MRAGGVRLGGGYGIDDGLMVCKNHDTPEEEDIIADLTLDISSSTYALHAVPRDDDTNLRAPSLSDADLDEFFGELYKHATPEDNEA